MPTGDKRVNLYHKRNVPQKGWEEHFFTFLDNKVNDTTRAAFLSAGVLDDKQIGLTSSVNDTISLDLTDADRGIDDSGHIVDLGNLDASLYEDYPFENNTGDTYYVGFRYQSVPNDLERNPRSSEPEYPWYLDTIGELGNPDSVTDNSTDITLVIDGILENGVDHSGRPVVVWLVNPVSPIDSVGYYTGTVVYSGGENQVVIPYTALAGPLGQTAPQYPISTTALDYVVHVQGISWFKNTDISTDGNYVFVGTVLGNGPGATPTVFDTSNQKPVFFISLDRAYRGNSLDVPAVGRTILADSWAVRVKQNATVERSWDVSNTAFEVDKTDETVEIGCSYKSLIGGGSNISLPFASYRLLQDGTNLQTDEVVTMLTGLATITFDRVGVDLTQFTDDFLLGGTNICIVEGTLNNAYDGTYLIDTSSILSDRFDVKNLDGSSPSFPAGTGGTVNVYMPHINVFSTDLFGSSHFPIGALTVGFGPAQNGLELYSYGSPVNPGDMVYQRGIARSGGESNVFYSLHPGRIRMRGGGSDYINYPRLDNFGVVGWAHFQSDKRDSAGFDTDWTPAASDTEWGFDYRGSAFTSVYSDSMARQLMATFRHPLSVYDGGNDYIQIEEAFTQSGTNDLTLTRGGVDATQLPWSGAMYGAVLCEVEFDTPQAGDGVFVLTNVASATSISLRKISGQNCGFLSGTGKIRFYGGALFGKSYSNVTGGSITEYVLDIVPPRLASGAIRCYHKADTSVTSTDNRYLFACVANGNIGLGMRDGGIVTARSLTTRASSGLSQWDQLDTDLLTATNIQLTGGTYDCRLSTVEANCNVFKRQTGGSWTANRIINIFKFSCGFGVNPHWVSNQNEYNIKNLASDSLCKIPFYVPQGVTLNSVSLYVDPATGDGTGLSFGAEVMRKTHSSTTATSLMSGGMQWASSATIQNFIMNLDQNQTIDNASYAYWIMLRSSDSGTDYVYSARCNYTVSSFGEHFFDCF